MRPPRRHESRHLSRVTVVLALFYLGMAGNRAQRGGAGVLLREVAVVAGFVLALWLLHQALALARLRGDEAVIPLIGLLTGLGLLFRMRLQPPEAAWSWSAWALYPVALVVLAGAVWLCRRRLDWLEAGSWLAGLAAVAVLYYVVRHGVSFRGAMFAAGRTTPTEAVKPLMVVFLAGFLKQRRDGWELLLFGALWSVALLLLVKQSDLGMVVILGALALSLWFVATGRTRYLLVGLVASALAITVLWYAGPAGVPAAAGRSQRRVDAWLDPWQAPHGLGYQTVQALFAIRSGGIDGAGLGGGQVQLVPLVRSDFVWAGLSEELGLAGSLLVLLAYLALYRRGYRVAALCRHPFRQRLAVGCVTVLAIQTLLNLGGVLRLVPITGITLPFISHGGSSLLVSYALVGMLLAVGDDVELTEQQPPAGGRRGGAEAQADRGAHPGDGPGDRGPGRG